MTSRTWLQFWCMVLITSPLAAQSLQWTARIESGEFTAAIADPSGGAYAVGTFAQQPTLVRYSAAGELEWERILPTGFVSPAGVLLDAKGHIRVVARHLNATTPVGLLNYSPEGDLIWSARFDGPDFGLRLSRNAGIDGDGNIYICGSKTTQGNDDGMIVCVDQNGSPRWSHRTAPEDESYFSLALDPEGIVTVAGRSETRLRTTYREILVERYSSEGEQLWQHRYFRSDSFSRDSPSNVTLTPDGGCYVTVLRTFWLTRPWTSILRFSAAGELLWERDFRSTTEQIYPGEARLDLSGNLIVTCNLTRPNGERDILLVSYSLDGVLNWTHRHPGPVGGFEHGYLLRITSAGELLAAGQSAESGLRQLLLRLNPNGAPLWMNRFVFPDNLPAYLPIMQMFGDDSFLLAGRIGPNVADLDGIMLRFGPPPGQCPSLSPCPGDLNSDCEVDLSDLSHVLAGFGTVVADGFAPQNGDADFDADIDLQDLAIVLAAWAQTCR